MSPEGTQESLALQGALDEGDVVANRLAFFQRFSTVSQQPRRQFGVLASVVIASSVLSTQTDH